MNAAEMREAAARVCDLAVHGLRVLAGTLRRDGETAAAADCSASAARIEVLAREIRALPCDDETERLRARVRRLEAAARAVIAGRSHDGFDPRCECPLCRPRGTIATLVVALSEREGRE